MKRPKRPTKIITDEEIQWRLDELLKDEPPREDYTQFILGFIAGALLCLVIIAIKL